MTRRAVFFGLLGAVFIAVAGYMNDSYIRVALAIGNHFPPIVFGLLILLALGINPILLIIPAGIAASCAFMLPVATPPNAIVFGSGQISIPQMSRAGFWLNLVAILLIPFMAWMVIMPVLGVSF